MTAEEIAKYLLYGLITVLLFLLWNVLSVGVAGLIAWFKSFLEEFKELRLQMQELNNKLANILNEQGGLKKSVETHDGQIDNLFKRVTEIEKKQAVSDAVGAELGH